MANRVLDQAQEAYTYAAAMWGEHDHRTIWYRDNLAKTQEHYAAMAAPAAKVEGAY